MKNLLVKRLLALVTLTVALCQFQFAANASSNFFWTNTTAGANPWNTAQNWNPNGVASLADTNVFGTNGVQANATTINSEVTASTSISTLLFTNIALGTWHVIQIPSGVTLTITTNLTVGSPIASDSFTSSVAMVDAGTLQVSGNTLTIGNNGATAADRSTILDLSHLSNFVYSANSGTITMATGSRSGSDFKLANGSNFITAATWNDNTASSSSTASGNITLGAVTNVINVSTFNIAAQRGSSTVLFPAGNGGLRLRGVGGTDVDRASMSLGNRNAGANSGGISTGMLSFNGHPVDMKLSTLTLGQSGATGAAQTNIGFGIVQFDTGVIDVTTINMAIDGADVTNAAGGTITVGANATLNIGSGGVSLVNETVAGFTNSTGNIFVSGGVVNCANSIVKTTARGFGNISITNGTLKMTAGTIGTPAIPIDVLNLNGASLHLTVSAAIPSTNVVATTINTSGTTTITIDAIGGVTVPTTVALISYTGTDPIAALSLAPLPTGYTGNLVDNTGANRIDLTINPPPTLTWVGALSDATPDATWNLTDANWLNGVTYSTYADPDIVQFDDSASNATVTVSAPFAPGAFTVNNSSLNYVFSGIGQLSGPMGVVKQGGGSLTLSESGGDNFSGGLLVSGGSVTLQNPNSTILGGVSISAGSVLIDNANSTVGGGASIANGASLQIGNNDANGTLSGNITDNGSLTFDRSDPQTYSANITGIGSVTQNGSGTLTLSGNNNYGGSLTVNAGAVRANTVGAPGTTLINVNNGATFVAGAAHTNSMVLSNAIVGTSVSGGFDISNTFSMTIAANSTNIIYSADPQAPTVSLQFLVDALLHGSGTVITINAPTNSPDNAQGVRFRNTNTMSDFSGTLIVTNGVKAELFTQSPTAGITFSPIGTGKIIMYAGNYFGTNGQLAPIGTAYSELLPRNNSVAGSITLSNDLTVLGSGAAVVNALGSNSVVFGKLTIGNGQELIGYKASGGPTNVITFPAVSLTGGNATFSPHSSSFGAATQNGSDISLGAISEQTPGSGIIMGGRGNLTLSGVNTYSGNTSITNGVLFLTNTATLASPNIIVAGGARFDVSELVSTFALGSSQTLSNSGSTAVLAGSANSGSGTLGLTYAASTPSFTVTNGTLTLAATTTINVKNTGAALAKGSYTLISAANTGNAGTVAGTAPSSVAVTGGGIATAVTPSLQISGSQLVLVVPDSAPVITNLFVTNSAASGQPWSTNISAIAAAAGWSDPDGDTLTLTAVGPTSNLGNSVTTDGTSIFYTAPVAAEDFFTYTISDGTLTASGTIYLEPVSVTPPPPATGHVGVTNGIPTLTFSGSPNKTNVTQASTNLFNWDSISTNVADGSGAWQVIDNDATNYSRRFYRSYQPFP